MGWWGFRPYVPVAQRRANALRKLQQLAKKGQKVSPVQTAGRNIASTFWGKAWCDNLESYSDFSNRLPRGRTYVRNGSVLDLQIESGMVTALVSGSDLYRITVNIQPLAATAWKKVKTLCGREIGSLVELLQGNLSKSVMQIVTARDHGLFPAPREIAMACSCPDWAGMCKHLAATLYGIGNRLDHQPELLFKLRQVDHMELIAQAATPVPKPGLGLGKKKTIASGDLASVFGIELDAPLKPDKPPVVSKFAATTKTARATKNAHATKIARAKKTALPPRRPRLKKPSH